jgi:hypothetical protein
MIPAFERVKTVHTVHALDIAANVIGGNDFTEG